MAFSRSLKLMLAATLASGTVATVLAAEGGAATPPPRPAPIPRPALADALQALAASTAAAAKIPAALSCAVVDVHGDLVALVRMDGAMHMTANIARAKAVTSATFGQPSGAFPPAMTPLVQSIAPVAHIDLLPIQGGLPIVKGGAVVGAIGCSGATSQQDEDAARAGLAMFH